MEPVVLKIIIEMIRNFLPIATDAFIDGDGDAYEKIRAIIPHQFQSHATLLFQTARLKRLENERAKK